MLKLGLGCIISILLVKEWGMLIVALLFFSLRWVINYSYRLGLVRFVLGDTLSWRLIGLSLWITVLMVVISFNIKKSNNSPSTFSFLCVLIIITLVYTFRTSNILIFYILFEATLVPIFLLVIGWGYQPERVKASYYLLFYTLTASLPLLLGVFFVSEYGGTLEFSLMKFSREWSPLLIWVFILAFLIKIPVYFGHLWLPKAHVEAPVAGSMILAGVLLKLGGYGLLRVSLFLINYFRGGSHWLLGAARLGGIISSLICMRQTDIKSLVAYSSVAHMALVLIGIFLFRSVGEGGAIIIMIAHGLCSSGLFALVGMSYDRVGTRRILLVRSSLSIAPVLALWWFLFRIINIAAPPTPNLGGEVLIFMASIASIGGLAFIVGVLSFIGAVYNLFLFSATQHGNENKTIRGLMDGECREFIVLFFHLGPLLLSLPFLLNSYVI